MRVHVVGCGLIGASVARAAVLAGHDVSGWDASREARTLLPEMGVRVLEEAPEADLVVLATPPKAILEILSRMPTGPTVMDVASVKLPVLAAANERRLPFVGGHPLAGSERAGARAAEPGLFRGRPFFLVPGRFAGPADIERAEKLVAATEAVPVAVGAEGHDEALALTSHLVWVLSRSLQEEGVRHPEDFRQGRAFQDVVRSGASPEDLWAEILDLNRANVRKAWQAVKERVEAWLEGG